MKGFKLLDSALKFEEQFKFMESLGLIALGGDTELSVEKGEAGVTYVSLKDRKAQIKFGNKHEIFKGVFMLWQNLEKNEYSVTLKASFEQNGVMVDNSRNAVLSPTTMKEQIATYAAFGLNTVFLYNEETFEVDNQPYFGYMRMGYSQAEVRELCDFAKGFGIDLIPCVQTLAHLGRIFHWRCYYPLCDMGDTILIEEEATYKLIEDIVASWRKCVDSEYINIGMDEAFHLGRGKYLDKHGLQPRFEIMCRHLERVIEICKKYGFKPMMWSDMFFHIAFGNYHNVSDDDSIDAELLAKVPKEVALVYWDYYNTDEQKYDKMFKRHLLFGNPVGFAGGAWKWSGFAPASAHSYKVTKLALKSALENGIKLAFTTAWGDNGAECSLNSVLPVIALYGEYSYFGSSPETDAQVEADVLAASGYTVEEFFALCKPNHGVTETESPYSCPAKYLLFNDVLMGLFDRHTNDSYPPFYEAVSKELGDLAKRESRISYIFDTLSKLSAVIAKKCRIGVALKSAYDAKDKEALKDIASNKLPETLRLVDEFYKAFRYQWFKENRRGGFDVQDLRIGGLIKRIKTAIDVINMYLSGEIEKIEELEINRLYFDCRPEDSTGDLNLGINMYERMATVNITSRF